MINSNAERETLWRLDLLEYKLKIHIINLRGPSKIAHDRNTDNRGPELDDECTDIASF